MFTKEDDPDDPNFDFERWETHRASSRYGRLVLGVLFGKTTQRIAPTVLLVTAFSTVVFSYNSVFLAATQLIAIRSRYPEFQLPLTPFELTAPVLGLLLVFRTDTAYGRFSEGSQLAWEITASMRSFARRVLAYTSTPAFSSAEREAAREIIGASTQLHGFIMNYYLRGGVFAEEEQAETLNEVLCSALGVGSLEEGTTALPAESGLKVTPDLILTALTVGTSQRLYGLTDQERIALDDCLAAVSTDLAKCEKILSTPIPLGYTRSSVRFLWIWITLLPFALSRTFSDFLVGTWWEDKPGSELPIPILSMLFISFVFLSIEDIAVQIEEPFAILPLDVQHKWLMRDAEQTRKMMGWFEDASSTRPPPPSSPPASSPPSSRPKSDATV